MYEKLMRKIEYATNRRDDCAQLAQVAAERGDYGLEASHITDCRYWVGYLDCANEIKKEMDSNGKNDM